MLMFTKIEDIIEDWENGFPLQETPARFVLI